MRCFFCRTTKRYNKSVHRQPTERQGRKRKKLHKRIKHLLLIVLIAVFAGILVNVVSSFVNNAKTDAQIADVKDQIRQTRLKNGEYEDILSEENEEDFYRALAEDNLGYGEPNEKVYESVPGK